MSARRRASLDVCELALTRSVEEAASLFWTGRPDMNFSGTPLHVISGTGGAAGLPFVKRAESALAIISAHDTLGGELTREALALTGWRILNLLTSVAAESPELAATVEETLVPRSVKKRRAAAELVKMALILSAGEAGGRPSKIVREVAAGGSGPYAAIVAALAAFEVEAGRVLRLEEQFESLRRVRHLKDAGRSREDFDEIIGAGSAGNEEGAKMLLDRAAVLYPASSEVRFARDLAKAARTKPSLDFAIVAICRAAKLPAGSPVILQAIGRTIGWMAAAIAEYGRRSPSS